MDRSLSVGGAVVAQRELEPLVETSGIGNDGCVTPFREPNTPRSRAPSPCVRSAGVSNWPQDEDGSIRNQTQQLGVSANTCSRGIDQHVLKHIPQLLEPFSS